MSPFFAAVSTERMTSSAPSAPMRSSASSAEWRDPRGRPEGLPDVPGANRRPVCFGPVVSGDIAGSKCHVRISRTASAGRRAGV